jgi:hypothetical protein
MTSSTAVVNMKDNLQKGQSDIAPYTRFQLQFQVQIQFDPQLQPILLLRLTALHLFLVLGFLVLGVFGAMGEGLLSIERVRMESHSCKTVASKGKSEPQRRLQLHPLLPPPPERAFVSLSSAVSSAYADALGAIGSANVSVRLCLRLRWLRSRLWCSSLGEEDLSWELSRCLP